MTKNVLDTRDLQERLEELQALEVEASQGQGIFDAEDSKELAELEELRDEVGDEWQYGETLIHEDYFVEYAQELAEDIGLFQAFSYENNFGRVQDKQRDLSQEWPFTCIDWEQAAEELKQDYSEVTYQGETYYVRSA